MTEKRLLKHLGDGLTTEQIAEAEGVSKHTVVWWIRELRKSLAERVRKQKGP